MAHNHLEHTHPEPELPDSWHLHTPEEGRPQVEHTATANSVVVGVGLIATVLFVGAIVVLIVVYFNFYTTRLRMERVETTVMHQDQMRYKLESSEKLREYSWINAETAHQGLVTIPLEEAKKNVLQRYASGQ